MCRTKTENGDILGIRALHKARAQREVGAKFMIEYSSLRDLGP